MISILYIQNIPDLDSDAYAHLSIARQSLTEGKINPVIHWVWLPLYHYIQIPFIKLGAGITFFRYVSLAVSLIIPYIIFFFFRKKFIEQSFINIPLILSFLCITSPLFILIGTAAQPEAIFCLFVILFLILFDMEKYFFSSVVLALGVLLRYEMWTIPFLIMLLIVLKTIFPRINFPLFRKNKLILLNIILPFLLMIVWTFVRRISDGNWFYFILETKGFAEDVMKTNAGESSFIKILSDLIYYPVYIPYMLSGPVVILGLFGIKRAFKNTSVFYFSVYILLLLFISLSWTVKSSLGLYRHFNVIVPFYAVLISCGLFSFADLFGKFFKKISSENTKKIFLRIPVFIIFVSQFYMLYVWSGGWFNCANRTFNERIQTAEFIKSLPQESEIFTDEASVEILSGLDMNRFRRYWLSTDFASEKVKEKYESKKLFYIVTWESKMEKFQNLGTIIFTSSKDEIYNQAIQVLKINN